MSDFPPAIHLTTPNGGGDLYVRSDIVEELVAVLKRTDAYLDATLHCARPPENVIKLTAAIRAAIAKAEGR